MAVQLLQKLCSFFNHLPDQYYGHWQFSNGHLLINNQPKSCLIPRCRPIWAMVHKSSIFLSQFYDKTLKSSIIVDEVKTKHNFDEVHLKKKVSPHLLPHRRLRPLLLHLSESGCHISTFNQEFLTCRIASRTLLKCVKDGGLSRSTHRPTLLKPLRLTLLSFWERDISDVQMPHLTFQSYMQNSS